MSDAESTRAVVLGAAGTDPEVVEVPLAPLTRTGVRVRVAAAGVCHSDLSMVDGTMSPGFPLMLGHEASGTITAVGPEVEDVAVGDRVVLNWAPACRRCWFCLHGEPWLCRRAEGVVSTPSGRSWRGEELQDLLGVGAFAETVVVDQRAVVPLPDGVGLDVAAVLGCAALTGTGAVWNTARVRPGDSVLVIGLGGIGLCAVAAARLAGASTIIGVDTSEAKADLAATMGATDYLVSAPRLRRSVAALTGGRGVDHAVECVGSSRTIRAAWESVRRGGTCTVVGVGRRDDMVEISAMESYYFAKTLTGSVFGSSDPARDVPTLAAHIASGRLDLSPLITHRDSLDGVGAAFERMRHGVGGRSLLEIGTSS